MAGAAQLPDGTPDVQYEEDIRKNYPHTKDWFFVPFSPTKDCKEEVVRTMYQQQITWDEETFCLPVAGIEGDISTMVTSATGMGEELFHSWLLTQKDSTGKPFFCMVERANGYRHFFVTTFKQRQEAMKWIDT